MKNFSPPIERPDLEFISGDFLELAIPREKAYLNRYFPSKIQQQFIRYRMVFQSWKFFCAHTGYACSLRNLQVLDKKFRELEEAHTAAKKSMDFEELSRIEKGRFYFKRK